jgi:hypothetical protein
MKSTPVYLEWHVLVIIPYHEFTASFIKEKSTRTLIDDIPKPHNFQELFVIQGERNNKVHKE